MRLKPIWEWSTWTCLVLALLTSLALGGLLAWVIASGVLAKARVVLESPVAFLVMFCIFGVMEFRAATRSAQQKGAGAFWALCALWPYLSQFPAKLATKSQSYVVFMVLLVVVEFLIWGGLLLVTVAAIIGKKNDPA